MKLIILCIVFFCFLGEINCLSKSMQSNVVEKVANSPRDISCPDPNIISPCICSFDIDYAMTMDCSNIISDKELRSVFSQRFYFYNFYKLYIHYNDFLTSLSSGVFGNSLFEYIDFKSVSKLSTIDSNIFELMENTLTHIDFYNCNLTAFIFDFSSFSILDSVQLVSNSISSFNVSSPTVTYLNLVSNQLSEDKFDANLPNLETLHLEYNNFEQIPNLNQSKNLTLLYLNYNAITEVSLGSMYHSNLLHSVYMGGNAITNVEVDSIYVVDGGYIQLQYNNLTTLPEEVYEPIIESVQPQGLNLQDNPIDCGCEIAWLITNSTYLDKVIDFTTCADGELLIDLDPERYEKYC